MRLAQRSTRSARNVNPPRNYFFTPDVLVEVCAELGVPFRSNGYNFSLEGC